MAIRLISDEKIAETSSKGNQEKWFDQEENRWYKLDQFGYEALAETIISLLLEESNIESEMPFTFVRYQMERLQAHGRERIGCSSLNFLREGQALVTVNRLLTSYLGEPLGQKLARLPSNKQRIRYLAEAVASYTGLQEFPQYLTLLFEIDALFCNDDRHLNNIAVIEQEGCYQYCPIFDNGAGLLSNMSLYRTDVEPRALIASLQARPFHTSFVRQRNMARSLFGSQLAVPRWSQRQIYDKIQPLLAFYPERDSGIIAERVVQCIVR